MRHWTHWDTEQNEDGSVDYSFYRHDRHSITLTANGDGKWSAISRLSQTPDGVLDWIETDLSPALTFKLKEALLALDLYSLHQLIEVPDPEPSETRTEYCARMGHDM